MNPRGFLDISNFLLTRSIPPSCQEAAYRSAVSRSYYTCYLTLRDILLKAFDEEFRHKNLVDCLKNAGNDLLEELGDDLGALLDKRLAADYKMHNKNFKLRFAQDAFSDASEILETISAIKPSQFQTMAPYIQMIAKGSPPQRHS